MSSNHPQVSNDKLCSHFYIKYELPSLLKQELNHGLKQRYKLVTHTHNLHISKFSGFNKNIEP